MSRQPPVLWSPNPGPQIEFLACSAREVLLGGSVGGGKTDALLMSALSQTSNALHRAIIFRRSFPQLRDLIGRSHELFLPLGAIYNKQDKQWRFPSGAIVEFGFLDADEDKYNYAGRAFSFLGFDELTHWPGDAHDAGGEPVNASYVFLLSRLRSVEGSGLRLEVRSTCTPGGVGHGWVKARFAIPDDGSASERTDPSTGYRRVFIPARISDNPYLANTEYARFLDTLPEADRKTLKEGRWDVYSGQVFTEWNPRMHVCGPFAIPATWELWRACDDGYAAPACVLWFAHDRDITDTIYVIEELYRSGMTPDVMAKEILRRDLSIHTDIGGEVMDNDIPLDGVIDSAAFANTGVGDMSRAAAMNKIGCKWLPAEKPQGSRIAGISTIHARLALRREGSPGLKVFSTCQNLIRTLPALVYGRTNPEDVDDSCEQHATDALRYGLTRKKRFFMEMKVFGI
jgi:Terminase large subunit, T4likevirus-type, N-terminal